MKLAIVVAMAENRAIGVDNTLPWRLPEDLKRFKEITWGHPMIMGRLTFDSIGKALPGRKTIVVTRDKNWLGPDDVGVTHSISEALSMAESEAEQLNVDTAMVVGGAKVYEQLISTAEKLYVTEVHTHVTGDAFFPEINSGEWRESKRLKHRSETAEMLEYSFVEYDREPMPEN